jgi:glutamate racemase
MEIDRGNLATPRIYSILEKALKPMLNEGIDTVVLGCTHFPFVIPAIKEIVGPDVRVIDPSPAIARQVERLLDTHSLRSNNLDPYQVLYLTTGDPAILEGLLPRLSVRAGSVGKLDWVDTGLG